MSNSPASRSTSPSGDEQPTKEQVSNEFTGQIVSTFAHLQSADKPLTARELINQIDAPSSTITTALTKLVRAGYVGRSQRPAEEGPTDKTPTEYAVRNSISPIAEAERVHCPQSVLSDPTDLDVYALISDSPAVPRDSRDVSHELDISRRQASASLKRLRDCGFLERRERVVLSGANSKEYYLQGEDPCRSPVFQEQPHF